MKASFILLSAITFSLFSSYSNAYESYAGSEESYLFDRHFATYAFYGEFLYLKPGADNLDYGIKAIALDPNIAVPAISPNWKNLEINPDYHPAFAIGMMAYFPCPDLSVDVNWEHFVSQDRKSTSVSNPDQSLVGPYFDSGLNSDVYARARGRATSHLDQINLRLGRSFCFCNFTGNVQGGVGLTRIRETIQSSYLSEDKTLFRSVTSPSTFIGAGPQIGANYHYRLFDQLLFEGCSVASIFIGEMKSHTTFKSVTPETVALEKGNRQRITVPHRTQLVPSFEQKLGLSYSVELECLTVSVAIGYQWQFYLNAIQNMVMTAPQEAPALAPYDSTIAVSGAGFERTISDYMLSGPYIRLEFIF